MKNELSNLQEMAFRSKKQNQWFKENDLHLIRITDSIVNDLEELPEDLCEIAYIVV